MPKKLKRLLIDRIDFVDAGANQHAHVTLFKRDTPSEEPTMEKETVEQLQKQLDELTTKLNEATANVDTLTKANEALEKRLRGAPEPEPEPELDPVAKALVEKARQDAEEARREAKEAKDMVAKFRDDKRRTEFVAKAGEFQALAKADDFGPILAKIEEKLEEGEYATVLGLLKKGSHAVTQMVNFRQIGADAQADPTSAEAQIDSLAKALAKDKDLDYYEAYAKVLDQNPKLYEQYRREEGTL